MNQVSNSIKLNKKTTRIILGLALIVVLALSVKNVFASQEVRFPQVPPPAVVQTPTPKTVYVPQPQPIIMTPDINNSSNSSSNSSSSSRSSASASVDNNIRINNTNSQSQSQSIVFPEATTQPVQVITRNVIREVPVIREVIREVNVVHTEQPRVVTVPAQQVVYQQPQVVTVAGAQVKELPKTGAPLAALALAGLLPAGLKLRRFGKQDKDINPNYIWEERELSRVQ